MVTHLQDHHCNDVALKAAAKRRKEGRYLQKIDAVKFSNASFSINDELNKIRSLLKIALL